MKRLSGDEQTPLRNVSEADEPSTVGRTDQLLESIIEFLPDATFVIDRDRRIVAWNHACEVMTGVKKESMLGKGDYAYAEPFFGYPRPLLIDLLDESSPGAESFYKYVQRKDGVLFAESFIPAMRGGQGAHLWGEAAPLYDQEGKRCGAIEVTQCGAHRCRNLVCNGR